MTSTPEAQARAPAQGRTVGSASGAVPTERLARYPTPRGEPHPDPQRGWIRRMLPVLRPLRWAMVVAIGGSAIGMIARIGVPAVLGLAIDRALGDQTSAIAPYAWALVGLTLVSTVAGYASRRQLFRVAFRVETAMRHAVFDHLTRLSASFYDTSETGQLLARTNGDIRAVQMFLTYGPVMILSLASLVVAFGLMLSISVPLTIASLLPVPIVAIIGLRSSKPLVPISWLVSARRADVSHLVEENIAGVRVVRNFSAEREQIARITGVADQLRWAQVKQADISARFVPLIEHLPRLGLVAVLLYGGLLAEQGTIGIGALVAFSSYVIILQSPFRFIGFLIQMTQQAKASAIRVYELFDVPITVTERADAEDIGGGRGEVVFDDVRFGYGEDADVLRGFSLRIAPSETVALVGETASGKSTVARLLPRFYDPRCGTITIDGIDIRDATLESLRATVGVALDDPALFSMSIRDNIAFANPTASDERVRAAAQAAQALEFIEDLDNGFDEILGERGYTLSGGQRQRIALARALLADPQVLVLDDATSAIDVRVEELIHAALRSATADRTVLVIAHRLSTISLADRVVLLEGGVATAVGTHSELLASEPRYRELLEHMEETDPEETDMEESA